jgi:N-acetylmuramic acid 6-phosphate etherase
MSVTEKGPVLRTEMRNEASRNIHKMDTLAMLRLINEENRNSVDAVEQVLEDIAQVCDVVAERIGRGGRLFYVGAGTSGRLGVMDAAECPPTYGVPKDQVIGIIAGGDGCLRSAAEAQEDDKESGARELAAFQVCDKDVVIGISASGTASYVIGALEQANKVGAVTVSLCSNPGSPIEKQARIAIVTDTGPEVITGSTRMKSGNAQKMVLNMISTAAMVKTGKVYENLMINLKPTNKKLRLRMIRIVTELLGCGETESEQLLEEYSWNIRQLMENR